MSRRLIDLIGMRFGRWTILALHPERYRSSGHHCLVRWLCRCDCGTERVVIGSNLYRGKSTSCGKCRTPDLTGRRIGNWIVLALHPERYRYSGASFDLWDCRCDCGAERVVFGNNLRRGKSSSCGECIEREKFRKRVTKHGHTSSGRCTSIYGRWKDMRQRCFNPSNPRYPYYGGRGITACERWDRFENYCADRLPTGGDPPPGKSNDRINNDGNYEPGNVRWATRAQQLANRRPYKKRKARRSSLAQIQAYADSLARAASTAGGMRGAP
jgi:hypothetical protein